jgi:hypothetical protein
VDFAITSAEHIREALARLAIWKMPPNNLHWAASWLRWSWRYQSFLASHERPAA